MRDATRCTCQHSPWSHDHQRGHCFRCDCTAYVWWLDIDPDTPIVVHRDGDRWPAVKR